MHVLVTGATGFVGFHTVLALHRAGHTVRLGVSSEERMRRLYATCSVDIEDHVCGEITEPGVVARGLDGCDGVVHAASVVDFKARDAEATYRTNVQGTQLVIGGAAQRGLAAIVYVSSVVALYRPRARRLDEHSPLARPGSAYARSKVESERYVRGLLAEGAPIRIAYPSSVIGPGDPVMCEGNNGLAYFFNHYFMRTSGGMQIIDVREMAAVLVRLLEAPEAGPYLVSGHYVGWRELGLILEEVTGQALRKVSVPGWVLRALGALADVAAWFGARDGLLSREVARYATRWVYADDSRLRTELGVRYRPLEETLADTVTWLGRAGHIDGKWSRQLSAGGLHGLER
jgi:dihydroflavonol-4-reductase